MLEVSFRPSTGYLLPGDKEGSVMAALLRQSGMAAVTSVEAILSIEPRR